MEDNPPAGTPVPARPIDRSISIVLLHARESVMAHFRPLLAELGITEQQWRVLRILNEMGTLEATSLARYGAILMPSLTRIIKSLEEQNLIERTKDSSDARRLHISLTDAGRLLVAQKASASEAIHASIDDYLGAEKANQLLDLLTELADMQAPQK